MESGAGLDFTAFKERVHVEDLVCSLKIGYLSFYNYVFIEDLGLEPQLRGQA